MDNSFRNMAANMQNIEENQDGTLKGGFVSVIGGRYRIIINPNGGGPTAGPNPTNAIWDNENCANRNVTNDACSNHHCIPSTNSQHSNDGSGHAQYCSNGCAQGVFNSQSAF